ncbi:MAG: metallophosphoesterase [Alphaproteobacteria bacterium]|jgi:putative phosphoesterase|nr:metallophosphoesterase [Alphaproteobacteria bacterium]
MKVAIISDVHDKLSNLKQVINEINLMGIKHIICCGDLCSPFTARLLGEKFKGDVYAVFGNIADRERTPHVEKEFLNFHHLGDYGQLTLGGKKIFFVHYPEIAEAKAKEGKYDFVFHGHTHKKIARKVNDCLLLNPGEIYGLRYPPSYAILDLETYEYDFIQV